MDARRVSLISGATFVSLLCIALILSAVPVGAQESGGGIPTGTPARGTDTGNTNDPPDLVTIAVNDCTVSPGASVILEDGDGTQAQVVNGEEQVTITATNSGIEIRVTSGDFIGDHATYSSSDRSFDTDGDYTVAGSEGITGCAQTTGTARDADDDGANGAAPTNNDGPDDQQYGDRKENVIIKTVPDKPLPKTGGFPLLAGAGLMALAATLLGARVIGRR